MQTTQSLLNDEPSAELRGAENEILEQVLPKLRSLLRDTQPIPQVAMKLIALILKQRPQECVTKLQAERMVLPIVQSIPIQHDVEQGDLPHDIQAKPCRHLLSIVALLLEQDPTHAQKLVTEFHLTARLMVIVRILLEAHVKDPRVRLQEWLEPFFSVLHSLIRLASREATQSETTSVLDISTVSPLLQHPALNKLLHSLCAASTDRSLQTSALVLKEAVASWTSEAAKG